MKSKQVMQWGVPGGNGGPILISSWRCNFSIYLDIQVYYLEIQAIKTLLCLILLLMCCFLLFVQPSTLVHRSPEKWCVPALKSLRLPEFWTYKDRTRIILKSNEVNIVFYIVQTYSVLSFFKINL